jgi:hypothetical protein
MKNMLFLFIAFLYLSNNASAQHQINNEVVNQQKLPTVFSGNHADLAESKLRKEAALKFSVYDLPETKQEWETYKRELKDKIIRKTGAEVNSQLPLNTKITGTKKMGGYRIENVSFQTSPGVYATANLFVPDGEGPFPAAIVMMGHSTNGRLYDVYQAISHILALNGYVSLSIDPWGAGERTTTHGTFEYHGANLGASLMNIGESLMGLQITDNIRGVDLLHSLPYVDTKNIGATGTSGGGNQTMWLAALDSRVKAAVPVTSVGTFQSYVMASNCICETLIDGLTFTEEAGILALVAPNSLALYSGMKESNPAFYPVEMLRSYKNAKPVFELYGVGNNLNNQVLDLPHGYSPEMRQAMIGWFDLHLKGIGDGSPVGDLLFELVSEEELMVFPKSKRKEKKKRIYSTETYCKQKGEELRSSFLGTNNFDAEHKRQELREILRLKEGSDLKKIHEYSKVADWERIALETSDNKLIPLLHMPPQNNSGEYVIVGTPEGKNKIPAAVLEDLKERGKGIVLVDLSGTGELSPPDPHAIDSRSKFHTLSRAELWLGRTVLGEWVKELGLVSEFLTSNYKAKKITIDGSKEFGLAALFLSALEEDNADNIILRNAPISYLFDTRENIDFFSMAIHLPGILQWGDISLAAALTGKNVEFISPVSMSGNVPDEKKMKKYQVEFEDLRTRSNQPGHTTFN